jgi:hypothetical protein
VEKGHGWLFPRSVSTTTLAQLESNCDLALRLFFGGENPTRR